MEEKEKEEEEEEEEEQEPISIESLCEGRAGDKKHNRQSKNIAERRDVLF